MLGRAREDSTRHNKSEMPIWKGHQALFPREEGDGEGEGEGEEEGILGWVWEWEWEWGWGGTWNSRKRDQGTTYVT